jgi:hypothetical protein
MFEHVTILLSFVFAIALTHLLTSTTELIWARDRVRVSGLHALWMASAFVSIAVNWLSFGGLSNLKRWDASEVLLQLLAAVVQYYTCSLLSIRPRDEGTIDVPAFYERQRPAIFAAFAAMIVLSLVQNYWDRNNYAGLAPNAWILEDALNLLMLILVVIGGWARPLWLQWVGGLGFLGMALYFLSTYALPA